MIGPAINALGILLGGLFPICFKKSLSERFQIGAQLILGVFTVYFGLLLTWENLNGTLRQKLKELAIVLLAMALGKIIGRILRLQKFSNIIGKYASVAMADVQRKNRFNDGFLVTTALFCAGPLGILGSVQAGLNDVSHFSPAFVMKAGTDGLATVAFCATFGWGAMLSAIPVLAFESALVRCVHLLEPALRHQAVPMLDAVNATNGLLIFCVALLILEIKKVRVAEYLPSLVIAPLLTRWLW